MTGGEDAAFLRALGKRVRVARVVCELSQEQLAVRAGVSRNFVSAAERGAQCPDLIRARRLAAALGVPLGVLAGDQVEDLPS